MDFPLDPNFRRRPKTDRFCCVCYKDLKGKSKNVRLGLDGFCYLVLPTEANDSNSKLAEVGNDCAKKEKIPKQYFITKKN